MGQITVFSGPERRRDWSDEEQLQILTETFASGACVAEVARRHDVSTALVYTWRRILREVHRDGAHRYAQGNAGLALLVQQGLKRDPHGGDLFLFRGRAGSLVRLI